MSGGVKPFTATMNAIRIVKSEDIPAEWVLSTYGELSLNTQALYIGSAADTVNGGYFAVGRVYTAPLDANEGMIVKYDSDMNVVYSKRVAENDSTFIVLHNVVEDGQGGCIAVGTAARGAYGYEALIIRFDSTLDVISAKTIGDVDTFEASMDWFRGIIKDGSNFITVGNHGQGGSNLDEEMFIVRFDANLTIIDEKEVVYGSESLRLNDIVSDGQGGFIAVGDRRNFEPGGVIVKLDSSLNVTNGKLLVGTAGRLTFDRVTLDSQGGCVVVGSETIYTNSNNAEEPLKGFIAKFDTNLAIVDRKTYGEDAPTEMMLKGVTKVGSNYVAVGGNSDSLSDTTASYIVIFSSNLSVNSAVKLDGAASDFLFDVKSNGSTVYTAGWLTHSSVRPEQASLLEFTGNVSSLNGSLGNHDLTWSQVTLQSFTSNMTLQDKPYSTANSNYTERTPTYYDGTLDNDYSNLISSSV